MKNYDRKEVDTHGNIFYHLNITYHRNDGPAIECNNGDKCWYVHDKIHNDKGPSYINNGFKQWHVNNKLQFINNTTKTLKPQILQYNVNFNI
jgi:hypothetical protein